MKTPIELISEERKRQQEKEGWTLEHDDKHTDEGLAMAAALYASPDDNLKVVTGSDCDQGHYHSTISDPWPWIDKVQGPRGGPYNNSVHAWDKREQHSRIKRLQIAGALILAEMERIQRSQRKNIHCGFKKLRD